MRESPQRLSLTGERRMTNRLIDYWETLRGHRSFPFESDVDPEAVADVWLNSYLIQLRDIVSDDGNYTYLGEAIKQAFGAGLDGADAKNIISPNYRDLGQNFTQVISGRRPIIQEGAFVNLRNHTVRYRQCMLPLGAPSQDGVAAILGCMAFKVEE